MGSLTRLQGGSLDMSLLDWLLFHFTVAENVAKKWTLGQPLVLPDTLVKGRIY